MSTLADLALPELDLVFVENVGNMVCPAEFDIGERAKRSEEHTSELQSP